MHGEISIIVLFCGNTTYINYLEKIYISKNNICNDDNPGLRNESFVELLMVSPPKQNITFQ
jgi:hypothetical protein